MSSFVIRCPSVTWAQKGQRVLDQNGYRSRLTRLGVHGCAWGLEINAPDRNEALRLLEEAGILFAI
ncbi:MAG: DUF3343 domain-containing protein [Clostridia bacterium]|nr:DUF3343 domain-containing protein [Clostridia bacterium]